MTFAIHTGDCRELLRTLDDASVDSIVTDPPYELGFMDKAWDRSGIAFDAELWREVLRVAKPGAHLLAFGGSRTYHRMACAIEDAGWELRDTIMWVYGSGFPKSKNLGDGRGTALKPAWEPIVMARKPLIGTVASNAAAFGTGVLNIDACRVESDDGTSTARTPSSNSGSATYAQDAYTKSMLRGGRGSDIGRWPANVIHDGSEEVRSAFPEAPGQQGDLRQQGHAVPAGNAFGQYGPKREHAARVETDKSVARFFYCAKASKADREDGCSDLTAKLFGMSSAAAAAAARGEHYDNGDGGVNRVTARKNHHPTVKPTDLMRYLCRLVTPPGGLILDPFTGSGSTGRGAVLEGFGFIGCELSPEYAAIAAARIEAARQQAEAERIEREEAMRQQGLFV